MAERSKYQESIIRNYYKNIDAVSMQKLQEQVGELYLSEGKARAKVWERVVSALGKLKIPASRIEHLKKSDNPALVAKLVEELLAKEK